MQVLTSASLLLQTLPAAKVYAMVRKVWLDTGLCAGVRAMSSVPGSAQRGRRAPMSQMLPCLALTANSLLSLH